MINKKNLIKMFIIFFIINSCYFIFSKVYAASVTASVTGLELGLGETKIISVTAEPRSLGTYLNHGKHMVGYTDMVTGQSSNRSSKYR